MWLGMWPMITMAVLFPIFLTWEVMVLVSVGVCEVLELLQQEGLYKGNNGCIIIYCWLTWEVMVLVCVRVGEVLELLQQKGLYRGNNGCIVIYCWLTWEVMVLVCVRVGEVLELLQQKGLYRGNNGCIVIYCWLTWEVMVLVCVGVCEVLELLQQEGVLEDALDGFDEVRLQCRGVLLLRVTRPQKLLQRRVPIWNANNNFHENRIPNFIFSSLFLPHRG